jgi:hypothetical protein
MKDGKKARGWLHLALAVLLTLGLAAPVGLLLEMSLPSPASANSELHPGGRLFFPAYDVRGARHTFIIITRLSMFEQNQDADGFVDNFYSKNNNCRPGHFTAFPTTGPSTQVDAVHLEFYGKSCQADDEIILMSCADIDLLDLTQGNLPQHMAFLDQQGAVDVHFVINQSSSFKNRVLENSLLGYGVIVDPTEGWVAAYPAAAAKATYCQFCQAADGGTAVGYEPFPLEVFIPFALADDSQGGLINELYLWAPTFFPGMIMDGTSFGIDWRWFDGRERRFQGSLQSHSFILPLKQLDNDFQQSTFTCGLASSGQAENDGAPRDITVVNSHITGSPAEPGCNGQGTSFSDATHISDNLQTALNGFTSTSIGWWDIAKVADTYGNFDNVQIRAIRGMVGVVIARTDVAAANKLGNGDAIRLWHKDPCETAPLLTIGPPHLRDRAFQGATSWLVGFNIFSVPNQELMCDGIAPTGAIAGAFSDATGDVFGAEFIPIPFDP